MIASSALQTSLSCEGCAGGKLFELQEIQAIGNAASRCNCCINWSGWCGSATIPIWLKGSMEYWTQSFCFIGHVSDLQACSIQLSSKY